MGLPGEEGSLVVFDELCEDLMSQAVAQTAGSSWLLAYSNCHAIYHLPYHRFLILECSGQPGLCTKDMHRTVMMLIAICRIFPSLMT